MLCKTSSSPSTQEALEFAAHMLPSSLPAADNHTTLPPPPPPPPALPRVLKTEANEVEEDGIPKARSWRKSVDVLLGWLV
jgi:hypothetical protein